MLWHLFPNRFATPQVGLNITNTKLKSINTRNTNFLNLWVLKKPNH